MIPTTDSVYGLVVDNRWTHGTFTRTSKDGESGRFEMPFIGWATEVRWTAPHELSNRRDDIATNETSIVPVFLTEGGRPVTPVQINNDAPDGTLVSLESLLTRAVDEAPATAS